MSHLESLLSSRVVSWGVFLWRSGNAPAVFLLLRWCLSALLVSESCPGGVPSRCSAVSRRSTQWCLCSVCVPALVFDVITDAVALPVSRQCSGCSQSRCFCFPRQRCSGSSMLRVDVLASLPVALELLTPKSALLVCQFLYRRCSSAAPVCRSSNVPPKVSITHNTPCNKDYRRWERGYCY